MKRSLTTSRTSPLDQFFGQDVDRLFANFWGRPMTTTSPTSFGFQPLVDVEESDDFYLITADLPGLTSEDVHLEVKDSVLTLRGHRETSNKEENKKDHYYRYERSWGEFSRSFQLPQNVSEDNIEAKFENGVLEVFVPKAQKAQSKKIKVEQGKTGLFSKLTGAKQAD